jgi:hypothetical protein
LEWLICALRVTLAVPERGFGVRRVSRPLSWEKSVSEERAEPLAYAGMLSADFHVGGTLDPAWSTG